MQKILYFLSKDHHQSAHELAGEIERWLLEYQQQFYAMRFAIADLDVKPAEPLRMDNTAHPKDAMVSVWCDHGLALQSFESELARFCYSWQRYDVFESQPLKTMEHTGRMPGMCQVALIKKAPALTRQQWLDIWLGSHTNVAIETQSTLSYRQNITVAAHPSPDWPCYDGIVEESFPAEAMTDRAVFFDAVDNPQRLEEHQQRMMESCMRFIDFAAFDCIPMSEYIVTMFEG